MLTLTGTASVANYQTALDTITYSFSPTSGDPTAAGTDLSRSISWTVTDGSASNGTSAAVTSTLDTVALPKVAFTSDMRVARVGRSGAPIETPADQAWRRSRSSFS